MGLAPGDETPDGAAPEQLVLLAVSSGSRLSSAPLLQQLRASAALGGTADAQPQPEQLAGPGAPDAGLQQMLAFQAERIVQLEADKRSLAEEVESLRRSAAAAASATPAQPPPRVAEGVPPSAAAAGLSAVDPEGAVLASRGRQQVDDLRDLLQRSLAQLERPVRHLPLPSGGGAAVPAVVHAAGAKVVDAHHSGEIGERLRLARARVGQLTCSLIWNNTDDLDLHCEAPGSTGSSHIHWRFKKGAGCGGHLDVDMNAVHPTSNPIENIFWGNPPRTSPPALPPPHVQVLPR